MNIVFFYYSPPLGLLTIQDNVKNFQLLSKNNITLLNTYPSAKISKDIDLNNFDGILIDSTLAYLPTTLKELDANISIKLKDYAGVKILLKQDEHIFSYETARLIGQKKIDLVFTCLEESQISKVYPGDLVGEAVFARQLTGYISDALIQLAKPKEYIRSIDLSYRGSMQPLQCGRLGYEKWNIGNSVSNKLIGKQLEINISSRWADRIHGKDWITFLNSSKAVLGVESGSNLFDFTGEVNKKCLNFEKKNCKIKDDTEAFYKKAHAEFLYQYENNVKYGQISPRHFEAAATRTLQILYEGEYSNIFFPYKHYVPLKRDLSNFEEIIDILINPIKRCQITECAYEEIVMNEQFHYKKKVEHFDALVEKICIARNISPRILKNRVRHVDFPAMMSTSHEKSNDEVEYVKGKTNVSFLTASIYNILKHFITRKIRIFNPILRRIKMVILRAPYW